MIVAYALLSALCAAVCAVFVWIAAGPLWAALTYAGVGSVVLLGTAFLTAGTQRERAPRPNARAMKASRNGAVG